MDGSPSSIIMLGLGNGTFNGSPSLMVTLGYGVGDEVIVVDPFEHYAYGYTWVDVRSSGHTWQEVRTS